MVDSDSPGSSVTGAMLVRLEDNLTYFIILWVVVNPSESLPFRIAGVDSSWGSLTNRIVYERLAF